MKDGKETFSNVCLDDYGYLLALGNMLYHTENIKKIPRIIYGSWKKDLKQITELGGYYYDLERNGNWPWGMYYSIYCNEFAQFDPNDNDLTQLEKQFQNIYTASKHLTENVCPLYNKNGKSYGDIGLVNDKIPALVFNGKFDPATPEKYGQRVADALQVKDGFRFTSDRTAHGSTDGECAGSIIKEFFDNPEDPPNRDCWNKDESQPIEFELPNVASNSPWWQDLPQRITEALKQMWQEIKKQIEDTVNQWWQEVQDWINQQWEIFQKWLEDLLENWWQDFLNQLIQWLEELLTEILNQCLPSALLPVGVSAGVWISRRRKKR